MSYALIISRNLLSDDQSERTLQNKYGRTVNIRARSVNKL